MNKNWKKVMGILSLSAVGAYIYNKENNCIEEEVFVYRNERIPESFDGYTISHISDLHLKKFGYKNYKLIQLVKKQNPDLIVISGDLLDGDHRDKKDLVSLYDLIEALCKIAHVAFVPGNHEATSVLYPELLRDLKQMGVYVLEDEVRFIEKNGEQMALCGLRDPKFYSSDRSRYYRMMLKNAASTKDHFSLLLSHRPELFELYEGMGFDLIFSGHAHGGQIQVGKRKGVFAPDQGLFPKYCDGRYDGNHSTMIVSRGLGKSKFPTRIGSRPHLIRVILSR